MIICVSLTEVVALHVVYQYVYVIEGKVTGKRKRGRASTSYSSNITGN